MALFGFLPEWTGLTGLGFVLVMLPLLLLLHRLLPEAYRVGMLLAASLVFYIMLDIRCIPVLAGIILLNYIAIRLLRRYESKSFIYKGIYYWGFAVNIVIALAGFIQAGWNDGQTGGFLLGAAMCSLSGLSVLTECYRREAPYELDVIKVALYCCFFPKIFIGPLVDYKSFNQQMMKPDSSSAALGDGIFEYVVGLVKIVVFGHGIINIAMDFIGVLSLEASLIGGFMAIFTYGLALYFMLSGYGEIARGLSLMFGFHVPRTTYYPYQSRNVTDFFERFHITAKGYISRFLGYSPIPESKVGEALKIILTGMLLGFFIGLCPQSILWGLYLSIFVIMEKFLYPRLMNAIPILIGRGYSFIAVMSSFGILLSARTAAPVGIIQNIYSFFTGQIPLVNGSVLYVLISNWLLLLTGCFFATNLTDVVGRWFASTLPAASRIGKAVISIGGFVLYAAIYLA